ncbi:MAG: hypothetical protein CM1200mP30_28370 [Pseudomonadota bacterium]|nr:MAG: hypothetical protein CM1200mP30_28370 [Pseudomonadota bacterium]
MNFISIEAVYQPALFPEMKGKGKVANALFSGIWNPTIEDAETLRLEVEAEREKQILAEE